MTLLTTIDYIGTCAFAVSGAFLAMEKKLDPFGVVVIAFVTAIGGGTLRDLMIGNLPVRWLQNGTTTIIIFSSAIVTMLFGRYIKKLQFALFLSDALGLGLFTITGIQIADSFAFGPGVCIALGTVTACFGGVIRDVLLNEVPLLFRKEIYALACIAGGSLYIFFDNMELDKGWATLICILFIFFTRIIAVRFKLSLPLFYLNKSQ